MLLDTIPIVSIFILTLYLYYFTSLCAFDYSLLLFRKLRYRVIMGNTQHRYLTSNEAVEVLGQQHWKRMKLKLEKANPGKFVDLTLFSTVIHSRYERMVRSLRLLVYLLNTELTILDFSA